MKQRVYYDGKLQEPLPDNSAVIQAIKSGLRVVAVDEAGIAVEITREMLHVPERDGNLRDAKKP